MSLIQLQIHRHSIPYRDLSFDMIEIQGGTFLLRYKVECRLSDFHLGQHQVSQALWLEVMGKNPAHWQSPDRPVENVSWYDSLEFCNELSRRMGLQPYYEIDKNRKDPNNLSDYDDLKWWVRAIKGADGFRLPTEAECEYAALGGARAEAYPYSGTASLGKVGWYRDNSFRQTHHNALRLPNALGLYDMSGQLWEWCGNWYGDFPKGPLSDPQGPKSGRARVIRGGSWDNEEQHCGVAIRFSVHPNYRVNRYGLRLSRTAL